MSKKYTIAEARNHLGSVVHEAEKQGAVELTRRGQPVAMVISMAGYRRLIGKPGFFEGLLAFREKHAASLSEEPWTPERAKDSGRRGNPWL